MGQKTSQLFIVSFLSATTAFHITIDKIIIGNIYLIPTITAAMPDHRPAIFTIPDGKQGCKHLKLLSGYIGVGIVFLMDIAWALSAATIGQ